MKKTNLCLAIMVAVGLTACGSSSSGGSKAPGDEQHQNQEAAKLTKAKKDSANAVKQAKAEYKALMDKYNNADKAKKAELEESKKKLEKALKDLEEADKKVQGAKKLVPADTKAVGDKSTEFGKAKKDFNDKLGSDDGENKKIPESEKEKQDATHNPALTDDLVKSLSSTPSVTTYQYVLEGKTSQYDKFNNPERKKGAASVMGTYDLDEDNPELTNAVLAQEIFCKKGANGKCTLDKNGKIVRERSDIIRFVGYDAMFGMKLKGNTHDEKGPKDDKNQNLQLENLHNADVTAPYANGSAKNNGLWQVTSAMKDASGKYTPKGLEKDQDTTTRIFGKNYRDTTNTPQNSYTDAEWKGSKWTPKAIKLQNVQYGRITANLDPIDSTNPLYNDLRVEAAYRGKKADDAVSNYMYRGTGETSVAEMNSVPAGKYSYQGHAITYGLSHGKKEKQGIGLPNAYGKNKQFEVTGSFVTADLIVNKKGKKVENGKVFDRWAEWGERDNATDAEKAASKKAAKLSENVLITFSGDVTGNTFYGKAVNNSNKKGVVRGSFFHGDAGKIGEMGGAINSVVEGHSNKVWGAVFGAKQVPVTTPVTPKTGSNTQEVEERDGYVNTYGF